jgi:hypothetical protein
MAITTPITALPTPPSRSSPANFDDRADAFVDALADFSTEISSWTSEANATAQSVNDQVVLAEAQRVLAQEAAAAVVSQGTAAAWSSGTTYAQYAVAIGSNGRVYRSLVGSNLNNNPVTDLTGKWIALNPDPLLAAYLLMGTTLMPDWALAYQDPVGTYPPTNPAKPLAAVWSKGVERYRALFTWGTTGGETNQIKTVTLQYSSNSGTDYVAVTTNAKATLTYDSSGAQIAVAWSAP